MQILFVHGNYPAQFRGLAEDLGSQNIHDVRFLTARKDPEKYPIPGVTVEKYIDVDKSQGGSNPIQTIVNEQVERAQIIQKEIGRLAKGGFTPRLIIFHGGNGLGMLIKKIIPDATVIGYFEWYFSNRCAEIILGQSNLSGYNFIHARNISTENELVSCDAAIVPTEWQASQFPKKLRPLLTTIFDGIDLDFFKPGGTEIFKNQVLIQGEAGQITVGSEDLLLTYATRGMEPLRGFPQFMRALPELLERQPNLKVLIGGRDRSAYGPSCPTHNGSWKQMVLDELPILRDHPRIVYTGLMNYQNYRMMLQRTNLHCYFTEPFVTSWSLFEAAACGAPILCNRSRATIGTIEVDECSTIDSIDDVSTKEGIDKIIQLLQLNQDRVQKLKPTMSIVHAKKCWANFINKTLEQN